MDDHFNLYYIILEDMLQHPMSEKQCAEIKNNLEKFYDKIKPPWKQNSITIAENTNPHKK